MKISPRCESSHVSVSRFKASQTSGEQTERPELYGQGARSGESLQRARFWLHGWRRAHSADPHNDRIWQRYAGAATDRYHTAYRNRFP